jgi:hypothetical protein
MGRNRRRGRRAQMDKKSQKKEMMMRVAGQTVSMYVCI